MKQFVTAFLILATGVLFARQVAGSYQEHSNATCSANASKQAILNEPSGPEFFSGLHRIFSLPGRVSSFSSYFFGPRVDTEGSAAEGLTPQSFSPLRNLLQR